MTDTIERAEGEKLLDCGLTPEQKEKWDSTCSMMVWTCPGFAHLWYKLLHNHNGEYTAIFTKDVPNACTDGKNIIINPDWFFKLSLPERTYVMGARDRAQRLRRRGVAAPLSERWVRADERRQQAPAVPQWHDAEVHGLPHQRAC
jgi:hypothetical protein